MTPSKATLKHIYRACAIAFLCFFCSCTDNAIVDSSQAIENHNWLYNNRIRIPVIINDPGKAYNVFMNLRHTADYKYSNIYVIVREMAPDKKISSVRKEFRLAYPDGQWLGQGSGNLYAYQLQLFKNHHFKQKGTYVIEFEQNMRDNPLREISDVGLRISPAD